MNSFSRPFFMELKPDHVFFERFDSNNNLENEEVKKLAAQLCPIGLVSSVTPLHNAWPDRVLGKFPKNLS